MREVLTLERLRAMDADAAAALLAFRSAEGSTALDASILADWLALEPANAAAWRSMQDSLADFQGAEEDDILAAMRADARKAGPARSQWALPAAAAAVILLAVTTFLATGDWRSADDRRPDVTTAPPALTYANSGADPQDVQLADGTRMTLAAGSSAAATIGSTRRDIRLARGRAFFAVTHDPARPFAVRAGDQEIVALGTRFDVQLQPEAVRVILLEGRVSVRQSAGGQPATVLEPGQQIIARDRAAPRVSPADLDEERAWREAFVVFDNATLAEAATRLNRRGEGRLLVRDPAVASIRVTGRFRAGDLPRFGRSIAELHPVRLVQIGPSTWEIVAAR